MARQSIVGEKSVAFGKRVAKCYRYLLDKKKEAGETDYWLEVLYSAEYLTEIEYKSLKNDNDELIKMLSSIVKTTKENSPKSPKTINY